MPRLSWSEAFGLSVIIMAAFLMLRMFIMIGNDFVLCPERQHVIGCKDGSSLGHLLFDDVGTPPR